MGERLEPQSNQIREAAKWLIGSFAAVGAALIAGSQLSNIGKLPVCYSDSIQCARLWVAGGGAVTALLGVMWAVWTGVQLLTPVRSQEGDLKQHWTEGTPIYKYFKTNPAQLQGFQDFDQMEQAERDAYKAFEKLNAPHGEEDAADVADTEQDLDVAEAVLKDVLSRADDVLTIANHVQYVHYFRKTALKRLMFAAGLAATGIVAFSWAANPPMGFGSASLRRVSLVGADLSGANLRNIDLTEAVLVEADLTGADLTGADLTGADLTDVVWSETTCPDGTNSDDALSSCENHLRP